MEERKARTNGHSDLVADAYGPELVLDDLSTDELMLIGTQDGIDWSQVRHQDKIAKAKETARRNAPRKPPMGAVWLATFITWLGNIALLGVMYFVSYVVMPVSMLLLPYAEYRRVKDGIQLFDRTNADVLSLVIMSFMLGLLVVHASRMKTARITKPSLKITGQSILYFLGLGDKWRRQTEDNDVRLRRALAWLNRTVILLGTLGSLGDEIQAKTTGVSWIEGLQTLATKSELALMLELVGALVVTAVLLFALQFLVPYNFDRFQELLQSADFLSGGSDTTAAEDEAARQYVLSQIVKQRLKAQSK